MVWTHFGINRSQEGLGETDGQQWVVCETTGVESFRRQPVAKRCPDGTNRQRGMGWFGVKDECDTHMRIWASEDWNREEGCWVVCGVSETDSSSLVKRVVDSGFRDRPGKCTVGDSGIGG